MANASDPDQAAAAETFVAAADEPFRSAMLVEDDFLPPDAAWALREHFEAHFADPHRHGSDTHQVWNYWYVPGLYTYLRTWPERIVPRALVDGFHDALTGWAARRLGMSDVSRPVLSLYVDGCGQGLHNDSANGRFGYVYSLTRDDRSTTGGQTLLLKEGDLFRARLAAPEAGIGLYDLIEPDFNRLTIFDDRMPHGVQRVEGTMDPLEGRLVLHGHIREADASLSGPLDPADAERAVHPAMTRLLADTGLGDGSCHGPLVVRLHIEPGGTVSRHGLLVDRVARTDGGWARAAVDRVVEGLAAVRFPRADGPSELTLPLMIGGPLPGAAGAS